jgi:hypothetical protein
VLRQLVEQCDKEEAVLRLFKERHKKGDIKVPIIFHGGSPIFQSFVPECV